MCQGKFQLLDFPHSQGMTVQDFKSASILGLKDAQTVSESLEKYGKNM
jgi:hypothetical protein